MAKRINTVSDILLKAIYESGVFKSELYGYRDDVDKYLSMAYCYYTVWFAVLEREALAEKLSVGVEVCHDKRNNAV